MKSIISASLWTTGGLFLNKTKTILATQFHPEIKENNQGILVLEFFLENMLFHERSFGLK